MFSFIKSLFNGKEKQTEVGVKNAPNKTWVGTLEALWVDENNRKYSTFFVLYEDEDGNRSFVIGGDSPFEAVHHKLYNLAVVPWVEGCSYDYIYPMIRVHNDAYWEDLGCYPAEDFSGSAVNSSKIKPKKKTKKTRVLSESANNVIVFPGK